MNSMRLTILLTALILVLFQTYGIKASPGVVADRYPLPHVSVDMQKPGFWTRKLAHPNRLLLNPRDIESLNRANFKKDLYLCSVKDLPLELTHHELVDLLHEDWKTFGPTEETRYGKGGAPLGKSFWLGLRNNLNLEEVEGRTPIHFGLVVKRTNIRVFPTDQLSMSTPANEAFDRFQHSSLSAGSLVGIYHESKDKRWTYVQTRFIRGWVRAEDVASAKTRDEVLGYEESRERLVITGNSVNLYADPSLRHRIFPVQMGDSFPVLAVPGPSTSLFKINLPQRTKTGQVTFRVAYIGRNQGVHLGFLPYTQTNVANQAFTMLGEPYGWGDMFGARDCSRFIMDIFATFGFLMPRNSKYQAMVGENLWTAEEGDLKRKQKALDRAPPFATLLRLPGHIMLYLGKHGGRYYVIHNLWGVQRLGKSGLVVEKIGRVVVSDLSLGEAGPDGSLLERITDITSIGKPIPP